MESAQIDLEFSKQLLPSPTRSDTIASHLTAIRTQFPKMKDIKHEGKWIAGCLVFRNCNKKIGECIELIADEFGPVEGEANAELKSDDSFLLWFEKPYNPEVLGSMVADLCHCSVEPSPCYGNHGSVEVNVFGENEAKYTFSVGVTKSPTRCRYQHFWTYSVRGQVLNFIVHLENEWEKEYSAK